ncbi:ATP-binding protein [Actinomadura soli]
METRAYSGTGKLYLLIALGIDAAMKGFRVKYTWPSSWRTSWLRPPMICSCPRPSRYGRVDLLCIDELGYMALVRRGAELLFQVLTEREEKNSLAIASNDSFGGWTKTFTDPRLCAAIVDRLTYKGPSSKPAPTHVASRRPAPGPSTTPAEPSAAT